MPRNSERNDLGLGCMMEKIVRNKYAACSIVSRMPSNTGTGHISGSPQGSENGRKHALKANDGVGLLIIGPRVYSQALISIRC
uniref:Uncharacterized protein n=1 Tax=Oryza meridionalis TaxID=40149 RepID=A0A0E0EQP9_9ORYZ